MDCTTCVVVFYSADFNAACPPKYVLETEYVEAIVGESLTVHFTITSDSPLAEDAQHTLTCEDGKAATKRFMIQGSCITFRKVRAGDSGVYTISCRNEAGLVGKDTLELDVITATTISAASGSQVGEFVCFFFVTWCFKHHTSYVVP